MNEIKLPPLPEWIKDKEQVARLTPVELRMSLEQYAEMTVELNRQSRPVVPSAELIAAIAVQEGSKQGIIDNLSMAIRRFVVSARRNLEGDSDVLKMANKAWSLLAFYRLCGSPSRGAVIIGVDHSDGMNTTVRGTSMHDGTIHIDSIEQIETKPQPDMRKHVEDFAKKGGWDKESGEGAFEYVQRISYKTGWNDALTRQRDSAPDPAKGDIVGWLRRRSAPDGACTIPGKLAGEIADHIEGLAMDAVRYRYMRSSAGFRDLNGPGLYWYLPRHQSGELADRLDAAIDEQIAACAAMAQA